MSRKKQKKVKGTIPAFGWKYRVLLYAIMFLSAGLALLNAAKEVFPRVLGAAVYAAAACSLAGACLYIPSDLKNIRNRVQEFCFRAVGKNQTMYRIMNDYRYRTVIFTAAGLLINIIFAVFNGILGVIGQSAWYVTLAVYYFLLGIMRFWAVNHKNREISVYRNCNIVFIVMTVALSGIVILTVRSEEGRHYPGFTIYLAALYAFIKMINAVLNQVKAVKMKSPLLMTIRNIGYADACVSILSLQTAMFFTFAGKEQETGFAKQMNGLTGTVVCLMILVMGVHGIYTAWRMKKEERLKGGIKNDSYTCRRG